MTDAELAILSLLIDGPRSDHDLHTEIDARRLRRWTAIGISSMYYIVDKLAAQGLVERTNHDSPQRIWKLTSAGYGVLQTAVMDLLSSPHRAGRGFEVGLVNLHVLKPSQVRSALVAYRHELTTRLARARTELALEQEGEAQFETLALYSHTVTLLSAELEWTEQFIAQYDAQGRQDPPVPFVQPRPIPRIQQLILPDDPDSIHKETTLANPPLLPNLKANPPRSS